MSPVVDATADREGSIEACVDAVRRGEVVVIPTDTVYGIGADAFDPAAVSDVLEAKGRGRDMPPPVLVPDVRTIDGLARAVPDAARRLIEALWPGPLTLVLQAQPSLRWDLGETAGTVALRMPDDEVALAVLRETGPLAVTSANRTGEPAATSVTDAAVQLGPSVSVYVDGGPRATVAPSTILDCTGDHPQVLREGAIDRARLEEVLGADFDSAEDAPFAPGAGSSESTTAAPTQEWDNPHQTGPAERAGSETPTDTSTDTEASDDR
ncbi:L-threonylcarbamoyladenylate synthase [Janibacter alittae]|uniref:L-threonylcarbamoyladenylate synthase n=1 Tax=Janibacter alittae TaxID=3115209 RepID=A0ABZ2MJY8_9MICO